MTQFPRPYRVTLENLEALPKSIPIRATSYSTIVANGTCPRCRRAEGLYFCYNPLGDDDLLCSACAEAQVNYYAQHGDNNR